MIDAHVHINSISKIKEFGKFKKYKEISKNNSISKYCCVPIGVPENFKNKTTPNNDIVLKKSNKDSSIIPVYWFNVFNLPKKISKMFKAIKFHPDIGVVDIDDKRVINFVKKINLPVFVHTNESKSHTKLSKVINLAKKVEVPVIALHSGSVIKTFFNLNNYSFPKNVYFEISGIQYPIILKKIYNLFGAKRIIFGSDYPFSDPRVSLSMLKTIEISKSEFDLITKRNIIKILKI
jgi:hypothetical protein